MSSRRSTATVPAGAPAATPDGAIHQGNRAPWWLWAAALAILVPVVVPVAGLLLRAVVIRAVTLRAVIPATDVRGRWPLAAAPVRRRRRRKLAGRRMVRRRTQLVETVLVAWTGRRVVVTGGQVRLARRAHSSSSRAPISCSRSKNSVTLWKLRYTDAKRM